jgi:GT2 family glycosyltransferase
VATLPRHSAERTALTVAALVAQLRNRGTEPAPGGLRLPLAALRMDLDGGSAGTSWPINPDGVLGRALMMPAGAAATFPLGLGHPAHLTGRAQLLPHDWRDGRGAVRAAVTATDSDGSTRELWAAVLHAGDRGRPRGRKLACLVPATTTALVLTLAAGRPQDRAVARAIWVEPALALDAAPTVDETVAGGEPDQGAAATRPVLAQAGDDLPLVSVLVPVHDPPPHMLDEAVASVRAQTFTDWELCLVDDGSQNPEIIAALQHHAASDPRIHLARHETARGISAATNTATEIATGRYIALLDHDDTLTPDALQHVAAQIASDPSLDMLYSDEDVIGDAGLIERHIKPGWSPEHFDALMYTCHLGVYRRSLAVQIGGFQSRYDGCQDYDFVLRLVERTDRVAHIPRILYHWRAHAASTAGGDRAKPYAYLAQPAAISDHLGRREIDATVQFSQFPGIHRIVHAVDPRVSAALVLATETTDGLAEAAAGWMRQSHSTWTAVLAVPGALVELAGAILHAAGVDDNRIVIVSTAAGVSPTGALDAAARMADADHLVLLQTPVLGLTHDWLGRLLGYSAQPGIGAAGPVVLSADGRVAQSGIAMPEGVPLHLHHGSPATAAPPVVYNLSAVSGVLATPRTTYTRLGGLDAQAGELALIDYCLRAGAIGERTVIVPDARVRLTGPGTVVNDLSAMAALRRTWTATGAADPYYNAVYRPDRGDYILRRYD